MDTVFVEVTNGPRNWGKFMVGRFSDEEWQRRSGLYDIARQVTDEVMGDGTYDASTLNNPSAKPLLRQVGWGPEHLLVLDLQTGEGAIFRAAAGGLAHADLNKHKVWVCPMFEPFLGWLYQQDLADLSALPAHVDLPDAEFQWAGYRRPGPEGADEDAEADGVTERS